MKKALIIGIDYYKHVDPLFGCVNDAFSVKAVLEKNSDGTQNFSSQIKTSQGESDPLLKTELRKLVKELFAGECETALFYFSGHGHIAETGGYLIASDSEEGDDGLAISDIITIANGASSNIRNRIIVLDCCYSGVAGDRPDDSKIAEIKDGTTILTASSAEQYATEENGEGTFTKLFINALGGSAANLMGEITPGSVYAHIDQSLGPWDQRPVFKTNIHHFVSLRKVQSPIALEELQKITALFPELGSVYKLDPSFEPERRDGDISKYPDPDPENVQIFSTLQKYNRVNLLVPVDAPHMWHAAMESKGCKLTVLGEHYWKLVDGKRI